MTIIMLDRLAEGIRKQVGVQLSLPQVLEAGTWKAVSLERGASEGAELTPVLVYRAVRLPRSSGRRLVDRHSATWRAAQFFDDISTRFTIRLASLRKWKRESALSRFGQGFLLDEQAGGEWGRSSAPEQQEATYANTQYSREESSASLEDVGAEAAAPFPSHLRRRLSIVKQLNRLCYSAFKCQATAHPSARLHLSDTLLPRPSPHAPQLPCLSNAGGVILPPRKAILSTLR